MNKILTFTLAGMAFFASCNNEEPGTRGNDTFSEQEKADYLNYIADIEEREGAPVYHLFNPAPYPEDKVKDLLENSQPTEGFSTLSTSNGIKIGPYGGSGGAAFDEQLIVHVGEEWRKLAAVRIRCGKYIDALQFYWRDDKGNSYHSAQFGKDGGVECWVYLETDEHIRKIEMRHGKYVDGFTLYVRNATTGEDKIYTYGERNYGRAATTTIEPSSCYQIHGFCGSAGTYIDRLGCYAYHEDLFR